MNLVIIFLTVNVIKSICFQFRKPQTIQYNLPILNLRHVNETVVFFKEEYKQNELISSILTGLYKDQSVVLLRGENHLHLYKRKVGYKDFNVVLMTNTLNTSELNSNYNKKLLNHYWSPVYLIWVGKPQVCLNGTFQTTFLIKLQAYLNTMWHMYKIARVVVCFPKNCPNYHIIYDSKVNSKEAIYNRTIKVIKPKNTKEFTMAVKRSGRERFLSAGFPLRAYIFERFPTSIPDCDVVTHYTNIKFYYNNYTYTESSFCGLDGMIFHDYVKYFKFNLFTTSESSCNKYGLYDERKNETSGSLYCIVNKKIDISFNSRFMVGYDTPEYSYVYYISSDSLCGMIKRQKSIPLWHFAHNVFSPLMWILFLSTLVAMGTIIWLAAKLYAEMIDYKPLSWFTYVYASIVGSTFGVIVCKCKQFLLFKASALCCSIIVLALYQGNVNYMFTTKIWRFEPKTWDDLIRYQYKIRVTRSIYSILAGYVNYEVNENMISDVAWLDLLLKDKKIATVERKNDMEVEVMINYTDNYGVPKITFMDESFYTNYLSYIVNTGIAFTVLPFMDESFYTNYLSYIVNTDFPFIEETRRFMMRLLEAGLPSQYYIWTRRSFLLPDKFPKVVSIARPYKKFKLVNLRTAFCILLGGQLLSLVIFFIEKWKGIKSGRN